MPSERKALPALATLIALSWPGSAPALVEITPYAAARAEYQSNIFDLPAGSGLGPPATDGVVGDLALWLLFGTALEATLGEQRLHANVEGRRVAYHNLTELDHDEYLLDAGLEWRRGDLLDGSLSYRHERRMASFADRRTTMLTLETERIAAASLNLAVTPDWRVESGIGSRILDSPLPESPEFRLREDSVRAALAYLGAGMLSARVVAEHISGEYTGQANANPFDQDALSLVASYVVPDFSRAEATLGYTRRKEGGSSGNTQSVPTGLLEYQRDLTGKTALQMRAFRRLRSDTAGADVVDEHGVDATVLWQATVKTGFTAQYQWTASSYRPAVRRLGSTDRRDDLQEFKLGATWQPRPWLALRLYGGYQRRDATEERFRFSGYNAGIDIAIRPER